MVCGFLSEALAGRHTAVHTIYYEVDDEDGLIAIPGKYANRGETAEYLRQMSHAVSGRFHWYRSGGEVSLYNMLNCPCSHFVHKVSITFLYPKLNV